MQIRRPPESTLDSLNDSLFDISRKELHFQFGRFSESEDKTFGSSVPFPVVWSRIDPLHNSGSQEDAATMLWLLARLHRDNRGKGGNCGVLVLSQKEPTRE
ncbi:hypothetical protein M514_15216 [Trichuris suis]|uniref:Uncharacterized protein n=1 Tax=Trichuris suis TaxID=68888 RepID=A0A085NTL6_9BILA|nr:hypothetical protein M514_15216 [Trichuris suis]